MNIQLLKDLNNEFFIQFVLGNYKLKETTIGLACYEIGDYIGGGKNKVVGYEDLKAWWEYGNRVGIDFTPLAIMILENPEVYSVKFNYIANLFLEIVHTIHQERTMSSNKLSKSISFRVTEQQFNELSVHNNKSAFIRNTLFNKEK